MEEHCPECGNEIYKPFTYCNACGWEKREEKVEKKGKPGAKKAKGVEEEVKKPVKLKCKCGAMIKIKTSKRPLKIKCPKCGRTGTLKGPEKDTKEEPEKAKKESLSKEKMEKKHKPSKSKGAIKEKIKVQERPERRLEKKSKSKLKKK